MNCETEGAIRAIEDLRRSVNERLIGQEQLVEKLLISLLSGGHVLLEGPPGIAKTRAVKLLAEHLEGTTARIQCTPDLLPTDLLGTQVFHPGTQTFDFLPGPIFHSLVLVDEINRSPPKVQSALLEAMAEHQVTSAGETRHLPAPFMVVATQNPIEHEGTFPLPEAQLDRFLLHLKLDLPGAEAELEILNLVEAEDQQTPAKSDFEVSSNSILKARKSVSMVHLAPVLKDFIVRLVMATREGKHAELIEHPVSPRGTLALASAARAKAYLEGRDHALPEDVQLLAMDALAHRLVPSWTARSAGKTARSIIADILNDVDPW